MSRTAEDWGRLAVSLPGWRWMAGMRYFYGGFSASTGASEDYVDRLWEDDAGPYDHAIFPAPDPDDPATAGCLLALLGPGWTVQLRNEHGPHVIVTAGTASDERREVAVGRHFYSASTLGRACIAAAAALGRWPGGEE